MLWSTAIAALAISVASVAAVIQFLYPEPESNNGIDKFDGRERSYAIAVAAFAEDETGSSPILAAYALPGREYAVVHSIQPDSDYPLCHPYPFEADLTIYSWHVPIVRMHVSCLSGIHSTPAGF